jgi:transcriptional regulator with XRE-family HTH domain
MAVYFSEKFKQYRKAKDLTQEQLAEIFHVSPQAISRWETGATYPDIEILPSIAAYFKITVDDLLGVDKIKDMERISKINKEVSDKCNSGHLDDALEILRNAVREFPHEYSLQTWLALILKQKPEPNKEKAEKNLLEAIDISEHMLENSTDDSTRCQALFSLSQNYNAVGDKEKAVKTAQKLSGAFGSSDVVLAQIYKGDELHKHLKKNISNYSQMLAHDIERLADSMYNLGSYERIKLINKALAILDLIYENGDYGTNNFNLFRFHYQLACNYYKANDMDNTLHCLEKTAQYAIAFDTTDLEHHTSIAVQGLGKNMNFVKNYRYNECYNLLQVYGLALGEFKSIRDDERFKSVIANLEKHAKSD